MAAFKKLSLFLSLPLSPSPSLGDGEEPATDTAPLPCIAETFSSEVSGSVDPQVLVHGWWLAQS